MPTYEYKCDACDHAFELFQSITAAPTKKCPKCGKSKVRRLISAGGGMIFKGSGFYITDYRSDNYQNSAKADSTPTASADAKSDNKSDVKSESKPDTKPAADTSAKPAEPAKSSPTPAKTEPKSTSTASSSAAKPSSSSKSRKGAK